MFYFDKDNYADESIINEHGGTFGVKDDPLKHPLPEEFVPETDIQAARRDAGLSTVGIRDDGTDYYGTSNEEYKSIVDYLQNTISGEGIQEKMSVLPPKSIEKIVEHRTVKALNEFDEFNTFNIDDKEWLAEKNWCRYSINKCSTRYGI